MGSAIKSQIREGSVLGGVLLLAGSCIGAGMLALPVITGIGGFIPSIVMFFFAWLFMTTTGLLLLEANLAIGSNLSLISIAEKTLGLGGKFLCWILFLFLFYSLSIAYIAASGSILQNIFQDAFLIFIPSWLGSLLFTLIFGIFLYIGTRQVDYLNRLLMVGLVLAYLTLVVLGFFHIHVDYLLVQNWKYSIVAAPILIISFGFHNMIPSMAMYFKGDVPRLRITVLAGSFIPLIVYLIWEAVMLGIIPVQGRGGLLQALDQGQAATQALRQVIGKSWVNSVAQIFALFAIITSFLAQSLSLVDFLGDGLKISKAGRGRLFLVLLTLVPPFILAFIYPGVFLKALSIAGGFSAVILFGVMPAMMVWIVRYRRRQSTVHIVPGGKVLLSIVLIFALGIFFLEFAQEIGYSVLPRYMETDT